jgi:rhodanese-related sulfurtransferase
MSEEDADGYELSPKRVAEMVESGEAELIDVRLEFEWDAGRAPAARHVPLDRLPEEAGGLGNDVPVVFVCRTGTRSSMATEAFRQSGRKAYNLAGGMEAWVDEGLAIEPEDGVVAGARPDNS